jgi:hypothetical protein
LYPYIPISLYPYILVSLYPYILVSLYPCILVSLYACILISLYPCTLISLYPYILVSLYPYILLSFYPYIIVSLYPYILISLYPYILVSLYPYILIFLYPYIPKVFTGTRLKTSAYILSIYFSFIHYIFSSSVLCEISAFVIRCCTDVLKFLHKISTKQGFLINMFRSEFFKYQILILFLNDVRNFVCNTVQKTAVCTILYATSPHLCLSTGTGAGRA